MKTIFIDVRNSFSISNKSGKFNGGNNYAIKTIKLLLNSLDVNEFSIALIVLPGMKDALSKLFDSKCQIIEVKHLSDIRPELNDIYFNPHIRDEFDFAKELELFKRTNSSVKVFLTIHDRRHRENLFDKYDGIFKEGIKSNWLILGIGRTINAIKKDIVFKRVIACSDEIFTVSNYSMQKLCNFKQLKRINYYIPGVAFKEYRTDYNGHSNYILFVSAGRSEKNFIRALRAFEKYVIDTNDNAVKLVVTGLNKSQENNLKKKQIIDNEILNNQVEILDYVDNEKLDELYAICRFLLFTSKSEGYGLPVLEALMNGKPSVVSRKSSIPEVLSSTGVYVDPYSVESISTGIKLLMDDEYYSKQIQNILVKRDIIRSQMALDDKIFVDQFIN